MSIYAVKPQFQALLRPAVAALARTGVTANQVTVSAAIGSVLVGWVVSRGALDGRLTVFLLLPAWLLLRMALNAADGMLAREHGQKSRLGAYLNELSDVVSDVALYAPFALVAPFSPGSVAAVVVLAVISEFAGALGPMVGAPRQYRGPMGKSDRAAVFGVLGAWIGFAGALPPAAVWIMPALAALLALTTINRVRAGLAEAKADGFPASFPQVLEAHDVPRPGQARENAAPSLTDRPYEENTFRTSDGVDLFYRRWPATQDRKGAILVFHRGHEHSGRVAHLADELGLPGFDIFAWDARGHGLSPGERGHSPSFARSVRDVEDFARHVSETYAIARHDMAVVAQSVGAVLATAWVHDYAPPLRALVLGSPAFSVKLYVPFARPGLGLLRKLRGNFTVNSYVKPKLLTHDPARIESFKADPLVTRAISVDVLLGLYATSDRIVADARAITVPTQLLISGDDWVVRHRPQHRFFERLGSATKERHVLPGFFHDTLGEKDRAIAIGHARRFVSERFDEEPARPSFLDADRMGYTRDQAEVLASPLPAWSPEGLYWAATRAGLRFAGVFSDGIALGHRTGFDSGSTLDYVYRNRATGFGVPGRLVDRAYLDSPGWSGIRERKAHVEELLAEAMRRLRDAELPVRVVDVAAGHGRYVLDALASSGVDAETILLRDYSPLNVAAGRDLIAARGLGSVARFEEGDAFDEDGLAALDPRPTLAVVSGLFELFPSNAMVRRSLAGLAKAVPPGGWLVYTGQPWHPQLAFIARALTSHRGGSAWVMRRRTVAEMDQLVAAAGFRKVEHRVGREGIFTVSLARREG
jgi:alpha-beta hydrolase superfamily lysophospholipase/phosphatidylglycerophosphate synthase